ncbi:hypothetical protein [Streptacidiphilus neutrinimicus]|uniref:hypothetical protein n=1 Tax=Streptacidiphilus neutrinimicus TaxID=105420 RepID=UPI0005A7AE04|nr:hypothetical protein [Streptacidiphilus neutrinimicus]
MPDHRRVDRPEWQALWHSYEPVTTPLRALGLPVDIETCGGQTIILVDLPDRSQLVISDEDALPNRISEVKGWAVSHGHEDRYGGTSYDLPFYDSTSEGAHQAAGPGVGPMLDAVTAWVHREYPAGSTTELSLERTGREAAARSATASPSSTQPAPGTAARVGAARAAHPRIVEPPPGHGHKR